MGWPTKALTSSPAASAETSGVQASSAERQAGQHRFRITVDQILPRDVEVTCVRKLAGGRPDGCGRTFLVPSAADSVCCPECRLYQNGPGVIADPQRAQRVADARRGFGQWAGTVIGGYGEAGPKDRCGEGD